MQARTPTLFVALIPVVILMALLAMNVWLYGEDSSYGPNQIALILSAAAGAIIALRLGHSWENLQKGIIHSISAAMPAIIILLLIGALAGTWMLSGIVPSMIYYGLKILSPTIFIFASCVICCIVSLASGSSWSTVATVGIALIGIGNAMGFNEALVAGSIISGAYFGDKMSPLSDTTNLAPAVAGTDLFTHIRYMMYTTVPAILITLALFLGMGLFIHSDMEINDIHPVMAALEGRFAISPVMFVVPALVIAMIIKKVPAIPALLIGSLLGGVLAIVMQPDIIRLVADTPGPYWKQCYIAVHNAIFGDISITAGNETVDSLLSTGGMAGMLNTVWLILSAMMFGGVMEASGLLQRITAAVISRVHSTGSLIGSTAGTCMFFNVTTSDQYISIIVPGRMFAKSYEERGLAPENLSRTLEDSGTVTSVLVPWNTCGATQASVLGVATLAYLPFCFFNILSPLMTILYGYLGIKIAKLTHGKHGGTV